MAKPKLGPTGRFPRGKLCNDDEGETQIGVTMKDKTVIIAFGKPTAWLGLDRTGALRLAEIIKRRAEEIPLG